jgi:folate-binding protein YgfZ
MNPDSTAYRDYQQRGAIADLSARTKLRLTGADRVRYLNGQVTANVTRLGEGESLRACVTTAKGKLCADVFIAAALDGLIVDADPSVRETLGARLDRYIVADDVVLEDLTDTRGLLHFLPAPGSGLDSLRGEISSSQTPIRSPRFGREGIDFFLPITDVPAILTRLGEHHARLDDALCESLRIEAGLPRWGRELTEDTLPPEAGLDRTHIDFHKGCYIGQEVISRIKSVGHVNRTLAGFTSDDGTPLFAGRAIFSSEESDARPIGTLTSAAWSFALERPIALGYLKRGSPTGGLIARPADSTGPGTRITPHPLPFSA